MHYEEKLELRKQLETDSKGNTVFRHFNDKFFPVDGRGFGAEGQRDCFTNALRNYGYVLLPELAPTQEREIHFKHIKL